MSESDKETIISTAQLPEHIKGDILPPLKSMGVLLLTLSGQEFHSRNIQGDKKEETCMEDTAGLPGEFKKSRAHLRIEIQLQNFPDNLLFWKVKQAEYPTVRVGSGYLHKL